MAPGPRESLHGHQSPCKMKPARQGCSIAPPLASRALPARLTRARSRFPERRPGRPRTGTLWLSLGWGRGSEDSEPGLPPPLWPPPPSDWGRGALRPPGGPPAAVPETRAGGGGRPRRPHRPPGPSGRSPLTSANFLPPLGGQGGTGARTRRSPRPGWASRLLVGAPGHPPLRGAGQMAGRFTFPPHSAPS